MEVMDFNDIFSDTTQSVTSVTSAAGNTKTAATWGHGSVRRCVFTHNNPPDGWLENLIDLVTSRGYKYCFGEEVGKNGTFHIQGYIEFKSGMKFRSIKNLLGDRCHIEKARGNRKQNLTYTQKDGKFHTNFELPLHDRILQLEYGDVKWRLWQQFVLDLYRTQPHPRRIHWYVDRTGAAGKSFFARFMFLKYSILLANGRKTDVYHQVAKRFEGGDECSPFKMVIVDAARSQFEYLNYSVLEELKNGIIFSGKYEGGTFAFPIPHVVVFANEHPDKTKLSNDRWHVNDITEWQVLEETVRDDPVINNY